MSTEATQRFKERRDKFFPSESSSSKLNKNIYIKKREKRKTRQNGL